MAEQKIKLQCPNCGASANGSPSFIEKRIKCPKCEQIVQFEIADEVIKEEAEQKVQAKSASIKKRKAAARHKRRSEAARGDYFKAEKKALDKGVLGGLFLIVIAVVWFVLGLMAGYIFYYPPILFIIGIVGVLKGLATGNIAGDKSGKRRRRV